MSGPRGAVLFDIDGTLIDTGGAGRRALARAADEAFGLPPGEAAAALAAIDFRGATDRGITLALATAVGRPLPPHFPRLLARYEAALREEMRTTTRRLMPGVRELIDRLDRREELIVGLLTGNFRNAARIKLAAFRLAYLADRPGGFGDDGLYREDIARAGVRRAGQLGVAARRVLVVGDTPRDVEAARQAGARTAAVASGWTAREDLAASGPDLLLEDLRDPAPLLALVDELIYKS